MTQIHLLYDAAGTIRALSWSPEPVDMQYLPADYQQMSLPLDTDFDMNNYEQFMIQNGQVVPRVYTLTENKAKKVQLAIAHFSSLFTAPKGYTYNGYLMQIDDASRANISAAVNDALTTLADSQAYPFQVAYWVAADNSHMALSSPDDMIAFGRAALAYFVSCRIAFRAKKDSIIAAADQAALDAIDVTTGYPSATNAG